MKVGAFLVVAHLGQRGEKRLEITRLRGPGIEAACAGRVLLAVSAFAAGIARHGRLPRKVLRVPGGARHCDAFVWLVVIAAINSVIGAYYYLRVIIAMYFSEPAKDYTPRTFRASRRTRHRRSWHPVSRHPAGHVLDFAKAAADSLTLR